MFKKTLFWEALFFCAVVGVLNYFANIHNWYWSVRELDSLVHFLAGLSWGLLFLWFYFFSGFFLPQKRSFFQFLILALVGILFIAVSCEIYELLLGEAVFNKLQYPFDTTLDFIMDFLGALVACLYGYLREMKSEAPNPKSENISDFDIRI